MSWEIEGASFETCSCDVVGPCTASLELGADYDRRRVTLVFHVTSGDVDGADVSGLTVAAVTPRRSPRRSSALFSRQIGGPMQALGPHVSENLGVERAPIEVREEGLYHSVTIGDAVNFEMTLLKLQLPPRWLTSTDFRLAFTSGVSANSVCFERELLDHYRLVFDKDG